LRATGPSRAAARPTNGTLGYFPMLLRIEFSLVLFIGAASALTSLAALLPG
jgi:hypothetical protein